MDFFISSAYAQAAGDPSVGMGNWVLLFIFIAAFWFLIFRPQMKRQKEHKSMVEALSKGDEVVTSGGILGKITEVGDTFLTLEVANNVQIKVQRYQVGAVMPKGTIKSA